MLCFIVAVIFYLTYNFGDIQRHLSMKINWNIDMPNNEAVYTCSTSKANYYVCKIPARQQKMLCEQLIEQGLNTSWVSGIIDDLEEINVDGDKYPLFEDIDYCTKKTKRLSHVYLLYSSEDAILYVVEYLD